MKKKIVLLLVVLVLPLVLSGCKFGKAKDSPSASTQPTPKPKVNLIDFKDRPYVTLQPTSNRNELEFRVGTLPLDAKNVEVVLEYNRNKGVMDAVLKDFSIDKVPYSNKLFMGSKSAGGHITYHEDVIGGTLTLSFTGGKEPYVVEVPWRYDDTQPRYTSLATTDMKFQLVTDQPLRSEKVVVMQSPGLPSPVDGKVLAGPYLVRVEGPLLETNGKLTIRLEDAVDKVKLLGFNGQKWQELPSTMEGRMLSATVPLLEAYVVTE